MTTWNYIIGNEKDFEGAPDWATVKCYCSFDGKPNNDVAYCEGIFKGARWKIVNYPYVETMCNPDQWFTVAQREPVTNAAPVATDDSKYNRPCKGITIDVYDVLKAFNVTCPALQHLIKKALAVGQRGHKDASEDLKDILASAKRAIELSEGE